MLLKRDGDEQVVLHDDHGEPWTIGLRSVAVPTAAGGMDGGPVIEFQSSRGELLRVRYEGGATREEELQLDEVVVHFLKAQD